MPIPGYTPFSNPYQVREEDKDFLTLSANLGADYSQLRQANPFVQSLSQGQYINIPKAPSIGAPINTTPGNLNSQGGVGVSPYGPKLPPVTQDLSAYRLSEQHGIQYAPSQAYQMYGPTRVKHLPTSDWRMDLYSSKGNTKISLAVLENLQWQLKEGLDTNFVPAAYLSALGLTPEGMTAAGFVYDAKTGNYIGKDSPLASKASLSGKGTPGSVASMFSDWRGSTDPLRDKPGHYYADEKTAPLIGQIITLKDGRRRRLLADTTGRLYYGRIGASARGKAARRARAAAAAAAGQTDITGNMNTALSVILGS